MNFCWPTKRLIDVCEHYFSGTWGEDSFNNGNVGNVFIVRVSDVKDDGIIDYNSLPLRYVVEEKIPKYQLQSGDLVVVKSSGSKKKIISGKTALFVEQKGKKILASNFVLALRPNQKLVLPKWLLFYLNGDDTKEFVRKIIGITTYPNLKPQEYLKLEIPLPPLHIQKKIVARIEELFGKIDKAIELRKKALEETNQIFQSALQEVFKEAEKKWEVKKLTEISTLKRGPFGGSLKKEIFVKSGYKVYEQRNAIYNDFTLGNYFITEDKYNKMINFAVKSGDLIISCSGTIGKVAIVPSNALPGIINQALLKITPKNEYVSSNYLKKAIESPQIQARLFPSLGSAIKNVVSVKKIKNTLLPLPSLSEQEKIVAYLDNLQEKIEKLKQLQQEQLKELTELKQSILSKAFRGELVKQNPDNKSKSMNIKCK